MNENLTFLNYLEAWRFWKIAKQDNDFVLKSIVSANIWPARKELKAICDPITGKNIPIYVFIIVLCIATAFTGFLVSLIDGKGIHFLEIAFPTGIAAIFFWLLILRLFTYGKNLENCSCRILPRRRKSALKVPSMHAQCGIYGFKTFKAASSMSFSSGLVLGKVAFWGDVIEHDSGYRAEYAYPLSLEFGICQVCGFYFRFEGGNIFLVENTENGACSIVCRLCLNRLDPPAKNWRKNLAKKYGVDIG